MICAFLLCRSKTYLCFLVEELRPNSTLLKLPRSYVYREAVGGRWAWKSGTLKLLTFQTERNRSCFQLLNEQNDMGTKGECKRATKKKFFRNVAKYCYGACATVCCILLHGCRLCFSIQFLSAGRGLNFDGFVLKARK